MWVNAQAGREMYREATNEPSMSRLPPSPLVTSSSLNAVNESIYTHTHIHHPLQPEALMGPGGARRLNGTSLLNWVNQPLMLSSLIWDAICMDGHFHKMYQGDPHISPSVTECMCVCTVYATHSDWVSRQTKLIADECNAYSCFPIFHFPSPLTTPLFSCFILPPSCWAASFNTSSYSPAFSAKHELAGPSWPLTPFTFLLLHCLTSFVHARPSSSQEFSHFSSPFLLYLFRLD